MFAPVVDTPRSQRHRAPTTRRHDMADRPIRPWRSGGHLPAGPYGLEVADGDAVCWPDECFRFFDKTPSPADALS
jgi:hypothetical protein